MAEGEGGNQSSLLHKLWVCKLLPLKVYTIFLLLSRVQQNTNIFENSGIGTCHTDSNENLVKPVYWNFGKGKPQKYQNSGHLKIRVSKGIPELWKYQYNYTNCTPSVLLPV